MAVTVDDSSQDKGIGKILMLRSMRIAEELEMTVLWGLVSPKNKEFLAMAEKLEFSGKSDTDSDLGRIEINLTRSSEVDTHENLRNSVRDH
jgi:L-amino acid N-acyltransferase YncA